MGDAHRDISYLIMKNKKLGMDFVLRITLKSDQIRAVLFVDDADIIIEGKDA